MTKHSRIRTAGWIAAGALASTALLAPATAAAASPSGATQTSQGGCNSSLFHWDVATGQNAYAMLTVNIHAVGTVPENCTFSFSLNSYTAQGPTWPTSGTQALLDHQSITLSKGNPSGALTVAKPPCYGQTDLYTGTAKFDGIDGALPHYPNVVTPTGLISYSNGGSACQAPSSSPSQPVASESVPPSDSPSPSESASVPPSDSPSPSESASVPPSDGPSPSESTPVQSESIPPSDSPSPSDSASPSASPSDSPSASPSTSPSASPSDSASPSASPSSKPSSSPSGSVLDETGTPSITPPPTDTVGSSGSTGSGLPLVLAVMSALLLAALVATPSRKRSRR